MTFRNRECINDPDLQAGVTRKVWRRLIWFLFLLFTFCYLDRINIGFAALTMNKDLKLSATAFGFAITLFYIGYTLCEIPSNLLLAKYGARIWLARIMVTWGIASAATMIATGEKSLYVIRFLVGVAEAGFLPGLLLYLTYWFPQSHRARAIAVILIAQPVTAALGSAVSGVILSTSNFLGLAGWRWLFLFEGLPAIILGFVAYFYLTDRPVNAKWLTDTEKSDLQNLLGPNDGPKESAHQRTFAKSSIWKEIQTSNIVILSVIYFALSITLGTISSWSPQIVREVAMGHSLAFVGYVTALPGVCSAIVLPLWSRHSDRQQERLWHIVLPMLLTAVGWLLVARFDVLEVRLLGLSFCQVGAYCTMSVFWTVPPTFLSAEARPAGMAVINTFGVSAAIVNAPLVGLLRDWTHSFASGLIFAMVWILFAAVLMLVLGSAVRRATAVNPLQTTAAGA